MVGHDWGGAIAWIVAALGQGTRVERAVIANAPHAEVFQKLLWLDPVQRKASQYMRVFRDPGQRSLGARTRTRPGADESARLEAAHADGPTRSAPR